MRNIILFLLLSGIIWGCKEKSVHNNKPVENITLIFKDLPIQSDYTFPSGMRYTSDFQHIISYVNNNKDFVYVIPQKENDTISIPSTENYKEIKYNYKNIENFYFLLEKGDTAIITLHSHSFPMIHSKKSDHLSGAYNFIFNVQDHRTKLNISPLTLLYTCADYFRMLERLMNNTPPELTGLKNRKQADYIPLDTLRSLHKKFITNYRDSLAALKNNPDIPPAYGDYYTYILDLMHWQYYLADYKFFMHNH